MPNPANNPTTWYRALIDSDLKANDKLVGLVLRSYMNDHNEMAWPSVATIARQSSLSERSVQRSLASLCACNFLLINGKHPSGTHRYMMHIPPSESHPVTQSPPSESHPRGDTQSPELSKGTKQVTTTTRGMRRPSVEDVAFYVREQGYSVDPVHFHNYYEANGWKVGKNPMKDWKAAVRTWQAKEAKRENTRRDDGRDQDTRGLSGVERTRLARQRAREREQARDTN